MADILLLTHRVLSTSLLVSSIAIGSVLISHSESYAQTTAAAKRQAVSSSSQPYQSIRGVLKLPRTIETSPYGYAAFYFNLGEGCGAGVSYGKKGRKEGIWRSFMNCGQNTGSPGQELRNVTGGSLNIALQTVGNTVRLVINGNTVQTARVPINFRPRLVEMVHSYYDGGNIKSTSYEGAAFENVVCVPGCGTFDRAMITGDQRGLKIDFRSNNSLITNVTFQR
ncbi:hypothetical protein [Sphaerospermopsis sp. LEGE 08334]|jgi:hypothetical protein|uniref:hypothetical protein n=1 Tax=Sphaerospermopsis sp. LEGE 08334 TaxID=1828651 RepID=UPI0018810494|nr:hypothetical protein [Sphaerospermopsis sp. LEGE 08334]MBE9056454.1 hypothetical protein [Sphaerospermopsis sp. LEGE 08334]